uniref:Uncharacterized protein n=1 Tax=Globisporangium ultimum (strain ATCC 200006 / CBS 805.95 / DAOM BR144) TaxID=431595 RepID=K3X5A8_GLOUD
MTRSSPGFAYPLTSFKITFSCMSLVFSFLTLTLSERFFHSSVNFGASVWYLSPLVLGVSMPTKWC